MNATIIMMTGSVGNRVLLPFEFGRRQLNGDAAICRIRASLVGRVGGSFHVLRDLSSSVCVKAKKPRGTRAWRGRDPTSLRRSPPSLSSSSSAGRGTRPTTSCSTSSSRRWTWNQTYYLMFYLIFTALDVEPDLLPHVLPRLHTSTFHLHL